jgi:GNAT superfamily N-acetyltransferase
MIREAKSDEAFKVAEFMQRFEEVTKFIKVDPVHAGKKYQQLIESGIGKMFILEDETGKMLGGLGCIIGEDLHYPRTVAVETYWFIAKEHRGRGLELLNHFEKWAEDNNYIPFMSCLADSYSEELEKLYLKRGYKLVEKQYAKENF